MEMSWCAGSSVGSFCVCDRETKPSLWLSCRQCKTRANTCTHTTTTTATRRETVFVSTSSGQTAMEGCFCFQSQRCTILATTRHSLTVMTMTMIDLQRLIYISQSIRHPHYTSLYGCRHASTVFLSFQSTTTPFSATTHAVFSHSCSSAKSDRNFETVSISARSLAAFLQSFLCRAFQSAN